jgi:saccharopine dehydrogenase-like NADP-dependent oxidoreductase
MTKFGIVGGYGGVGIEVAKSLLETTEHEIIIGGRDKRKGEVAAENMGPRAFSRVVDVYDQSSLDNFCRMCDIVINCAAPSRSIFDRVALASMRQGIHYVDTGGDSLLYNALISSKEEEIKRKRLTFIVSAGIYPGLSGVFIVSEAKNYFDAVNYLEFYHAGLGRFTLNSAYDIICSMTDASGDYFKAGLYYENGERKRDGHARVKNIELPLPVGKVDAYPLFTEDLSRIVEGCSIKSARAYSVAIGKSFPMAVTSMLMSKQYETEEQKQQSAKLLVKASEQDLKDKKPFTMFHMIMKGQKNRIEKKITSIMLLEDGYKVSGIVSAITARLIMDGLGNDPGCFYLDDGIDINGFMTLLNQQGISRLRTTDNFSS